MATWPPFDLHAHVAVDVDPTELLALRAVIFAATRSLDEARIALDRPSDPLTVWGVGVHPGVTSSLTSFDRTVFTALVARTAYVSEMGLEGKAKRAADLQRSVLRQVLEVLQETPRIAALHSFAATDLLLDELEQTPLQSPILHWWLGDVTATRRAVGLGAYFSLNPVSVRRAELLNHMPLDRLLPETDHPFGDRASADARPGRVASVESGLARHHGIRADEVRMVLWRNLNYLIDDVGCRSLLPSRLQDMLRALA